MNGITKWFIQLGKAFRQEMSAVIHDAGVLLFFIGLPVFYPLVYTAIYNPEEVREIPFAVVDHCRSAESRRLVRQADATSAMKLYDYAPTCSRRARSWQRERYMASWRSLRTTASA